MRQRFPCAPQMLPKQQDGVEESSGFLVSGATPAKTLGKWSLNSQKNWESDLSAHALV